MKPDPYMPIRAEIDQVRDETPTIKTFGIRPSRDLAFHAGQFVELGIPGIGEAPFTPSSSPARPDSLELTVMRVGRVTENLHNLKPGEEVWIRGPLGQPYPIDKFRGRDVLIVGGGVGLAPLRALLFALFEDIARYPHIVVRYGARTPEDIVYRTELDRGWDQDGRVDVMLTVDHGDEQWTGHVGVVTTILTDEFLPCDPSHGVAIVCGPPVMMKFVCLELLRTGYRAEDIYLSMERNMSCGIGKCGHCRVGLHYACKDGPVFAYSALAEEASIFL